MSHVLGPMGRGGCVSHRGLPSSKSNIAFKLNKCDPQLALDFFYEQLDYLVSQPHRELVTMTCRIRLLHLAQAFCLFPSRTLNMRVDLDPPAPCIGEGATSFVVLRHDGQMAIATKEFKFTPSSRKSVRKGFIKEAIIMDSLRHENIIPFFGVVEASSKFAIVTPFMRNGDLLDYLTRNPSTNRKIKVAEVARGLQYLKSCGVIHGDLKPGNILVDDEGIARIADFGLARYNGDFLPSEEAPQESSFGSGAGTIRYMSPERLWPGTESARPTFLSDIFSFAMVVYEIYVGKVPYYTLKNDFQVVMKIVKGDRPTRDMCIPGDIWALAEACWRSDPRQRLQIDEVIHGLSAST